MVRKALVALGLLLAGPAVADDIPVVRFTVAGFQVEGDNPLSQAETDAVLAGYAGEYEGLDGLLSAADALEQAFAEKGYSFHRVTLPPQTLDGGVVKLQVVVFKLGNVNVAGNTQFSESNIRASVPSLKPGETPNTRMIARDLRVANRHPSKQVAVNMKESEIPDSIDATINVQDGKPWHLFGAFNNTGTDESGELRLSLGGQHSNLWDRDHRFTFTYTTAPDNAANVSQYGFNYAIPFYSIASELSFFLINSDVDTGRVASFFDVSGSGRFIGAVWTREMLRIGNYYHRWSVGFQDRDFTNDVSFLDVPIGVDVRSRPVTAQYESDWRNRFMSTSFYVGVAHNLGGGPNNDAATYSLVRPGASTDWDALRLGGNVNYFLPRDFLFRWLFDGQWSEDLLIPGEQFGVGGISSVRGFSERSITGDSGFRSSLEVWTPPLWPVWDIRGLVFLDYGYRKLNDPAVGQAEDDGIASIGLGARWEWKDQIAASVDYGHPISKAEPGSGGYHRFHFNLFVRY